MYGPLPSRLVAILALVLTTTRCSQVRGTTLSECAATSIFLSQSQIAGQPAPVAPYWFIAYPEQGVPTVYPLSLTGTAAPWTNNYPQGEPRFARGSGRRPCALQHLANKAAQEPHSCSTLPMRMETQEEYRQRFTQWCQANPKHVFCRPALPLLL